MSRRSDVAKEYLEAVSNSFAAATNSCDLGGDIDAFRLRLLATGSAQRVWVVVSGVALSDADAIAALGNEEIRRTMIAGDVTVGIPVPQTFEYPSAFRFVYLLTETSACKIDIEAENC